MSAPLLPLRRQTIEEKFGGLKGIRMAYLGDIRNNMTYDLMRGGSLMGFTVAAAGPSGPEFAIEDGVLDECEALAAASGGGFMASVSNATGATLARATAALDGLRAAARGALFDDPSRTPLQALLVTPAALARVHYSTGDTGDDATVRTQWDEAVAFAGRPPRAGSADWKWWRVNLANKLGGAWYSTLPQGECNGTAGVPCTWNLTRTVRRIASRCVFARVTAAVVSANATCFGACPQPANLSSACCSECAMRTVLGPRGSSQVIGPADGMPNGAILDAWDAAFASDDPARGGCPDYEHDRTPPVPHRTARRWF